MPNEKGKRNMNAFMFISITILVWGVAALFDKLALDKGEPIIGLEIRTFVVFITLTIIVILSGKVNPLIQLIRNDTRSTLFFVLSGLSAGLLGMLTYYAALCLVPVSQVVPMTFSYPLIAAVLGIIFLKEPFSLPRLAVILLIIAGIYLIQIKNNI